MPRLLTALVALALTAACISPVELANRPCPCADGWTCCSSNVCVQAGTTCPVVNSGGPCAKSAECPPDQECTPVGRCGMIIPGDDRPPKVMLAVDLSGSMKSKLWDETEWGCCQTSGVGTCSGYSPEGECKWNWLKQRLAGPGEFLDQMQDQARFGLTIFPGTGALADACAPGKLSNEIAPLPGENLEEIRLALETLVPAGGTPAASALRLLAQNSAFMKVEAGTSRFVVLFTDGLPNCNQSVSVCTACTNPGGDPANRCGDPRNCVDDAALLDAIGALRAKGVYTLVVWFGPAEPTGMAVLNAAAFAGGRPQQSGEIKYLAVGEASALATVLDQLRSEFSRCLFPLTRSVGAAADLRVVLTDTAVDPVSSRDLTLDNEWHLTRVSDQQAVEVLGTTCDLIRSAAAGRYKLSFLTLTEI